MTKLLALLFALGLCGVAWAQPVNQYVGIGAYPFQPQQSGFCQLTVSSGSVVTPILACTNGISPGADIAQICVEGVGIRYRDDGVNPTSSIGLPVSPGTTPNCFSYSAVSPATTAGFMGSFRMIGIFSAPATVDILFYK